MAIELAPFTDLVGTTWTNQDLASGEGGPKTPYSYNVMPLPQSSAPEKYILKNFKYFETLKFAPAAPADGVTFAATAPNRGGAMSQIGNALFYDQQVLFAEGPSEGSVVHVENGAWLNLTIGTQGDGPYGAQPDGANTEQPAANIAKQISVPHGNSVLALGSFGAAQKGPIDSAIPTLSPFPTPSGLNVDQYSVQSTGNLHTDLTLKPTLAIANGAAASPADSYISWTVDTATAGSVTNIPFEEEKAEVTKYSATYWLQKIGGNSEYTQLTYIQLIVIKITIDNVAYEFPHTDCNTLTKV